MSYSHWSSFSNSPAGAFSRRSFLIGGLIRPVPVSYRHYLILKRFRDGLGTLIEQVLADTSTSQTAESTQAVPDDGSSTTRCGCGCGCG